jgi:hypothetical protein
MHQRGRRPGAVHQPRCGNVADLGCAAVAIDGDCALGGGRCCRRATLARTIVDQRLRQLVARSIERRRADAHVVVLRIDRGASIEPDDAEPRAGHRKKRREAVLRRCAVVMRHHGRAPRRAAVRRPRHVNVVGFAMHIGVLQPVGDERLPVEPHDRRDIG